MLNNQTVVYFVAQFWQVGNASNQFSSAGPHNLYVLGQVHGCHFRTATSALDEKNLEAGMAKGVLVDVCVYRY